MTEIRKDLLPLIVWPKYFYDKQKQFITSKTWQTWFVGGNGSGKSLILYWTLVAYMMGVHPSQNLNLEKPFPGPPLKIKVLVPSFEYVEEQVLETLFDVRRVSQADLELSALLPKGLIKKGYTKDHRAIDIKNGSSLKFATSEQGWRLMSGYELDILGCDEEPQERVFDENVRGLRNAKGGGKIVAGLTPPYLEGQGPTWTKEKIVDAAVTNPDINVISACMADNPAIDAKFIKRFTAGKSKEQIDVQLYGKYPSWGLRVHSSWQDSLWNPETGHGNLLPIDMDMPENWDADWVMAFDWHESKPCAGVWAFMDHDGNIIFYDELDKEVAAGKTIGELCEIFKQIEGQPHDRRKFRRWQDPSAKSKYHAMVREFNAWDEFRRNGIITTEGRNRDPSVGINIVNDYLKGNMKDHPRMFVRENCKYTRQYMNNHFWQRAADGTGKPDPKWSDYPICIRYILQEVGWKRKDAGRNKSWPLTSYGNVKDKRYVVNVGDFFS